MQALVQAMMCKGAAAAVALCTIASFLASCSAQQVTLAYVFFSVSDVISESSKQRSLRLGGIVEVLLLISLAARRWQTNSA